MSGLPFKGFKVWKHILIHMESSDLKGEKNDGKQFGKKEYCEQLSAAASLHIIKNITADC